MNRHRQLVPLADRAPLRVLFAVTSMPVGGAETLLVNLIRRLDRDRFAPQLCCLKEPGPLGEQLAEEIPVHSRLLVHKYDLRVLPRLVRLFRRQRIDAAVTVGAGDKMFWGRLAARIARVPVVVSALHSTGWPDSVGRLNRILTPWTDAFVGVAGAHGRHLIENERFPADKVHVIPNGVDVEQFRPRPARTAALRRELGIPADAPVCGIVAALRPEKNHEMFLHAAAIVRDRLSDARFVIAGDGPMRNRLETLTGRLNLSESVHFLGTRSDVPELLSMFDVFALSSHNEASPVSILEAMATETPVVATRVGSVAESVDHGVTGLLVESGEADRFAESLLAVLTDKDRSRPMGRAGRKRVVAHASVQRMVEGYQDLICEIYESKCRRRMRSGRIVSDCPCRAPIAPVG